MIPKILHRIWLDDPMPPLFERWGERWRDLHPGWHVCEWRDSADVPRLALQSLFAGARNFFARDWKRFQADLLRLELLHIFGGVYVDTDVEPLRPIDELLDREVLVGWSPNRGRGGERLLTQAVLGAAPEHPFIRDCLFGIPDAIQAYRGQPLAKVIGPHHVTRMWRRDPRGIEPLSEGHFYPQSIAERDQGLPADTSEAYAHHHWNTTLRKRGAGLG